MKRIPLSQGKFTIIDDDDYEIISRFNWYFNNGYASRQKRINGERFRIYLHRFILGVIDPDVVVDHINGNKLDNRKSNLRLCTSQQNKWNRKNVSGSSIYLGVSKKREKSWRVSIAKDKKDYDLGTYDNEIDAALVYNRKAIELFGEFASLNPVEDDGRIIITTRNKTKTSKHKYINWYKAGQSFCLRITIKKKKIHFGYFKKEEDAVEFKRIVSNLFELGVE
jgi:hypothetical protein